MPTEAPKNQSQLRRGHAENGLCKTLLFRRSDGIQGARATPLRFLRILTIPELKMLLSRPPTIAPYTPVRWLKGLHGAVTKSPCASEDNTDIPVPTQIYETDAVSELPRLNMDTVTNKFGDILLSLCKTVPLRI